MGTEVNTDLKLRESNLFANGRVVTLSDGKPILERDFIDYIPEEDDKYYTIKNGDELDEIAFNHYREEFEENNASKLWWVLADSNDIIVNPLDISDLAGKEIVIPNITRFLLVNS